MLYEFGKYALDTANRRLTHKGEVVALTPKSFELLLLLLENHGRALSKSELMQALWPNTFVEEANLSFQISILRKCLGEDGPKWIETVPKHGYRFAGPAARAEENVAAAPIAFPSERAGAPTRWRRLWGPAAGGLIVVAVYFAISRRWPPPQAAAFTPVPLHNVSGDSIGAESLPGRKFRNRLAYRLTARAIGSPMNNIRASTALAVPILNARIAVGLR